MARRPITWQNVRGPDFRDSNQLRESSLEGLDSGLNTLANLAGNIHSQNRTENTDDLLNQIRGLASLEDLATARESGRFDNLNKDQFDVNAISKALADQEGIIQNNTTRRLDFNNAVRKQKEAPVIADISNLIASGKTQQARDAIDNSDIRDKAPLLNQLRSFERNEKEFQRREDSYLDGQKLMEAAYRLDNDRSANIGENRRLRREFADANDGVTVDGSGEFIFDPGLSQFDKDRLTKRFANQYGDLAPSVLSDKQQLQTIKSLAQQLNASPQQVQATLDLVRSNQADRQALTSQAQNFVAGAEANRRAEDQNFVQAIEDEYAKTLRDRPINIPETLKKSEIKIGDAVKEISTELKQLDNIDDNELEEVPIIVKRIVDRGYRQDGQTHKVPGWAMKEAFSRIGPYGLFDQGAFNDQFKPDVLQDAVNQVMREHLEDEANKPIIDAAKSERDNKLLARQQETLRYLSGVMREAKARSNVFDTKNAPSAQLNRSLNRVNRQR